MVYFFLLDSRLVHFLRDKSRSASILFLVFFLFNILFVTKLKITGYYIHLDSRLVSSLKRMKIVTVVCMLIFVDRKSILRIAIQHLPFFLFWMPKANTSVPAIYPSETPFNYLNGNKKQAALSTVN